MSSYTPDTDLWLERSRLDGMLLAGVSYGVFFLLTIQATVALTGRPHRGGQIATHRTMLISYVWITFVLATVGFAGNARYTEMIWIDLRDAPGGPTALIINELNYWVNMMSLTCYYVMEWFMQALLLHRCFILWNWKKRVIIPMSTIFAAMVAMSILVLVESGSTTFYNINSELIYLCLEVGLTIIYTLLVAGRLFVIRARTRDTLGREHLRPYEAAAMMVIESAAPYTVLCILFIVSFALGSYIDNLIFLSISHVQAIAQLLIIIRVAEGRAIEHRTSTQPLRHTLITFRSTMSTKGGISELGSVDPLVTDMARGTQSVVYGM